LQNSTLSLRPGRIHSNADDVSRMTCKQCWGKVAPTVWIDECERADEIFESLHTLRLLPELSAQDLTQLQSEDPEMGPAYTVMSQDLEPTPDEFRALPLESRHLLSIRPEVFLQDGLLLRTRAGSTHLIVPVSLRHRLFEITHSGPTAGHLGADRTFKQLRDSFFWPGMRRDITHWYRQCPQCATSKGSPLRSHGKLQNIPFGAPLDLVTIDILSGLPTASDGSKYLLVAVDAFTKWVEAYPLSDQEAHTCMTALFNGFFARFGLPRQLHSDQGRNFESSLVKELCEIAGVNKTRTTPFHPRSDGLTERANRTILQMLRATTSQNPQEWPSKIPSILSAYRITEHSTTHVSPNRAMLGRES